MSISVGIFAKYGMENPAADDWGAIGKWLQRDSVSFGVELILGPTTMTLVHVFSPVAWGQDSTVQSRMTFYSWWKPS